MYKKTSLEKLMFMVLAISIFKMLSLYHIRSLLYRLRAATADSDRLHSFFYNII